MHRRCTTLAKHKFPCEESRARMRTPEEVHTQSPGGGLAWEALGSPHNITKKENCFTDSVKEMLESFHIEIGCYTGAWEDMGKSKVISEYECYHEARGRFTFIIIAIIRVLFSKWFIFAKWSKTHCWEHFCWNSCQPRCSIFFLIL